LRIPSGSRLAADPSSVERSAATVVALEAI
jgi:hypothetical protein